MNKKVVAIMTAMVMLFGVVTGGTIAWLQANSSEVNNTFTFGNIEIDLNETDVDNDNSTKNNAYNLIPGDTDVKDPKVTVKATSEKCYVFVTVKQENNLLDDAKIIDFTINDTYWKLVKGTKNMYVYEKNGSKVVDASQTSITTESILASFKVTVDGKEVEHNITVNQNLEEGDITAMKTDNKYPKITFDACAVQSDNIKYLLEADEEGTDAVTLAKTLLVSTVELETTN